MYAIRSYYENPNKNASHFDDHKVRSRFYNEAEPCIADAQRLCLFLSSQRIITRRRFWMESAYVYTARLVLADRQRWGKFVHQVGHGGAEALQGGG